MQDTVDADPVTALTPEVRGERDPAADPLPLFVNRWSPRAMAGDPVAAADRDALFEAARWAPSAFNDQPWRFLYAERGDEHWERFLGLLNEFNREWARDAGLLVLVASRTTYEERDGDNPTHAFDAGAAWQSLALEATRRGLAVHPMAGFDHDAAREELSVPEEYALHAMVAVGERADPETLPADLRDGEVPNGRKPPGEVAVRGGFDG
jgi:nitroreductase